MVMLTAPATPVTHVSYDAYLDALGQIATRYTPLADAPTSGGSLDELLRAHYHGDAGRYLPGWSPAGALRERSADEAQRFDALLRSAGQLQHASRTPETRSALDRLFASLEALKPTITAKDFAAFWSSFDDLQRLGSYLRTMIGMEKYAGEPGSGGIGGHYLMIPLTHRDRAIRSTLDWYFVESAAAHAVRFRLYYWLNHTLQQLAEARTPITIADLACGCSLGMALLERFATHRQLDRVARFVAIDADPDGVGIAERIARDVRFPATVLHCSLISRSLFDRLDDALGGAALDNCLIAGFWDYFPDDALMTRWLTDLNRRMAADGSVYNGVFADRYPDDRWMPMVWPLIGRRSLTRLRRVGEDAGFGHVRCLALTNTQNLQVMRRRLPRVALRVVRAQAAAL